MTTTHIDKEARARLLNLYDAFAPTCASPQLKTLLVAILDTLTPLPADVESSPKPEGLKWGCKLLPSKSGMSGMGVYSPSGKYYLYKLSLSHAWAVGDKDETYTHFPSDAAALAALNACTTPPPDFVEPAKPEAGEQRVEGNEEWRTMLDFAPGLNKRMRVRSYCGQHELCTDGVDTPSWTTAMNGGSFTPYELSRVWLQMPPPPGVCTKYQASPSLTTPQPAEPKVMPLVTDDDDTPNPFGLIGSNTAVSLPKVHPPQPSEKAKGAEWLPPHMEEFDAMARRMDDADMTRWDKNGAKEHVHTPFGLLALGLKERDTQWRSFIESERAQHKAEMEAVKKELESAKGASR